MLTPELPPIPTDLSLCFSITGGGDHLYVAQPIHLHYSLTPRAVEIDPTFYLLRGEAWDLYSALNDYFWKEIVEEATENMRLTVPQRSARELALKVELIATKAHLEDMRMLAGVIAPPAQIHGLTLEWEGEKIDETVDEVLKEATSE